MINPHIEPISAFNDNYIWALISDNKLCVVDPGDAEPVIRFARERQLQLDCILITHHHADHIGGLETLRQQWPEVIIIDPKKSTSPASPIIKTVDWQEWHFNVMEVPGHTLDHIVYFCDNHALPQPVLFCGDTLFAGGCGRVFEGTMTQMFNSLQLLAQLPPSTLVYCAHEYTLANLRFALTVEPDNLNLKQRIADDTQQRTMNKPTVPSTLQLELATNPFLRCHTHTVQLAAVSQAATQPSATAPVIDANNHADTAQQIATFAVIREWKNNF
jgi:hydroxyacylglutathione hydrolase